MIGYWFSRSDGTTQHLKDPAAVGETHYYKGEPVPCHTGLHFSPTPRDALSYACGPIMWEVEGPDDARPHGEPVDKHSGQWRRYLRRVDLTRALRQFMAREALRVIDRWDAPAIVREYLEDGAKGIDRVDIRLEAWAAASTAEMLTSAAKGSGAAEAAASVAPASRPDAIVIAAIGASNAAIAAARPSPRVAGRDNWIGEMAAARHAARERFNEMALKALEEAE